MIALTLEERIVDDEKCPRSSLNEIGEGPFDFIFAFGVGDMDLLANDVSRGEQFPRPGLGI
jgi:hypothetical protein